MLALEDYCCFQIPAERGKRGSVLKQCKLSIENPSTIQRAELSTVLPMSNARFFFFFNLTIWSLPVSACFLHCLEVSSRIATWAEVPDMRPKTDKMSELPGVFLGLRIMKHVTRSWAKSLFIAIFSGTNQCFHCGSSWFTPFILLSEDKSLYLTPMLLALSLREGCLMEGYYVELDLNRKHKEVEYIQVPWAVCFGFVCLPSTG